MSVEKKDEVMNFEIDYEIHYVKPNRSDILSPYFIKFINKKYIRNCDLTSKIQVFYNGYNLQPWTLNSDKKFNPNTKIIFDRSSEDNVPYTKEVLQALDYYKSFKIPNQNIIIVNNIAQKNLPLPFDHPQFFLDFHACDVVNRVENGSHSPNSIPFSQRPNKISLALTKILKDRRKDLLEQLIYSISLKDLELSIIFNDVDFAEVQKVCSNDLLLKTMKKYKGPYDNSSHLFLLESGGLGTYAWPCNSEWYTKSLVSLVPETRTQESCCPFITEKTFRPIINLHPVVCLMHENYKLHLENLGFNLYRKIIGNYNSSISETIDAAKQFLTFSDKQRKEVDKIAYNNSVFLQSYANSHFTDFMKSLNTFLTK
jgi:hypothetical protein